MEHVFLKFGVLGDPDVGKREFLKNLDRISPVDFSQFSQNWDDFITKEINLQSVSTKMQIWRKGRTHRANFYRHIQGYILFYHTHYQETLQNLVQWRNEIMRYGLKNTVDVIIGTRIECEPTSSQIAPNTSEVLSKLKENGCFYFGDISCFSGLACDKVVEYLVALVFAHYLHLPTHSHLDFEELANPRKKEVKQSFFSKLFSSKTNKKDEKQEKQKHVFTVLKPVITNLNEEQKNLKKKYWLDVAEEIRQDYENQKERYLLLIDKPLIFLLCCRSFAQSSLFHKDYLPFDVFKIIVNYAQMRKLRNKHRIWH